MNIPHMEKESHGSPKTATYQGQNFDRMLHAWMGRFTGWMSPASYALAYDDWLTHLAISPAKRVDVYRRVFKTAFHLLIHYQHFLAEDNFKICEPYHTEDRRFNHELWNKFPFNFYSQSFLMYERLWNEHGNNVRGLSKHRRQFINFIGNRLFDMISPSNFILTNPEILSETIQQRGQNLIRGLNNYYKNLYQHFADLPLINTDKFKVGIDVALTKGKVIYRNHLIELIQYESNTPKVYPEPILIVPAWIMKYYILDLSPHNSLVKYLVDNGHTVFMISWKNPTGEDSELSLDDYINLGIMESIQAINHIIPNQKIHAVGYCIGGTLLTMAAAALCAKEHHHFHSITLFAAQVDFKDAGELLLFVDESQISFLEDVMWEQGYLKGPQMADTFSMLRSVDLIWSRIIRNYLLGEEERINDLVAWDHDTTRLPYKMHSEYLRKLFLNNELVQGQFKVNNKKVALMDIHNPVFVVSTLTDHIAPWKSVYKIHLFTRTDITFVLTSGGHNAGIVSEPGHPNRHFQMDTQQAGKKHVTTEKWLQQTARYEGSWWPQWQQWLVKHSGEQTTLPPMGNPEMGYPIYYEAPGIYVLEK